MNPGSSERYDVTLIMAPMWSTSVPWTAPAFLCESLRQHGYRVQFLDYNIRLFRLCETLGYGYLWEDNALFTPWIQGHLSYLNELFDVEEIRGNVVGFCTTQTNLNSSIVLAQRIRKLFPARKIIFGGHAVYFPEQVAGVPRDTVDAICKGEGEGAIVEVLERGFSHLDSVPGLYLPEEGGWRLNNERTLVSNLDDIPWPRYADIDHTQYGKRYLALVGSRGCTGKCVFCSERCRFPGYRVRSAANQVDELEYLSAHFDVQHFPYYDALVNGNYRVLREKSNEILRRGLQVDYSGNLMIRDNMPDDLFPLMRKSGFSVAFIGIESGSAHTLAAMRKRHDPDLAASFLRKCHNAGIRTEVNFIIGFPTETEAHFQETIDFVKANRPYIDTIISVNTFGLGPSDLWDLRDSYGIVIDDPDNYTYEWHTVDGQNTLDVRRRRLERFLLLEEELGMKGECLITDGGDFAKRSMPSPETLLSAYEARFQSEDGQTELATVRAAVKRARDTLQIPTPLGLAHRFASSLRARGLRQTVKRAKQWMNIQRSRRSGE